MIGFPIVMVVVLTASGSPGQHAKVLPFDEAAKDKSFLAFRADFLQIVRNRDSAGLMKLIHEDTEISFGGSVGPKDFIEWWHPEDRKSKLWPELETILKMGGGFSSEGAFVAPYVSAAHWPDELDEFEYSTIVGRNVRCYSTPSQVKKPIRTLSFDIVRTSVNDSNFAEFKRLETLGWRQIEMLDGKVGYVRSKYVRSCIDQRIYFTKGSDGKWFISAFIAGD